MITKKEIKIVGAGLSGLTAGINLAKAGYKVKIFEKNNVVGKRFHGDYQGIENWIYNKDALEHIHGLGVKTNFPNHPVKEVKIITPSGEVRNIKSKHPFFYLVKRGTEKDTLDQSLYRQAVEAGVEVVFNSPKDHRNFGDIIAQGYFPDKVTDAIVVGYTFQTDIKDQYWVIVDDNLAPDGYSYFFVTGNQATLAVCMFEDFGNNKHYLEKTYQAFSKHINFKPKDKKLFGGSSNGFLMKKATFNGRLYVGESAGFIDGMWGFGMKFALMSGYLAAQSIISGKSYEKSWRKELYPQVKASLVNRWYYKMFGRRSYEFLVKRMKKSQNPRAFLNKFSTYSLIHKMGLPFAIASLKGKLKDRRNFNN